MRIGVWSVGVTRLFPAVLVLCCVCAVAHAEVAVGDDWAKSGRVSIDGTGWSVSFDKKEVAIGFASDDQLVRIVPFYEDGSEPDALVSCEVVQTSSGEQAEVHAVFTSGDNKRLASSFSFSDEGTLRIRPAEAMHGIYVRSPVAVGVLPGIQLEDVLYRPESYPDLSAVHVPAENWFAGLLHGNNGIIVCAWPEHGQRLSLMKRSDAGEPLFETIKIVLAGEDLYMEVLAAPSIWHNEKLQLGYLEKDVEIEWTRPFPATYKTQLPLRGETTTPRTFVFRKKPNAQYRPEVGNCAWPAWFEGDRAYMRLSKKIPPRGDAIMYPMEDGEKTLMGFVRRTPLADVIVERNTRAELPHGPRGAANVGFVACGGTGLMRRTIFASGGQNREKEFLMEYADFLADYVAIVQKRHAGFFTFIDETRRKIGVWMEDHGDGSGVRGYLEQMTVQADRAEEDLRRKMELYGDNKPEAHMARADRVTARLKELLDTPGPEVYPECDEIINTCNRLAWGHAESAGMRFSMLAREWAQEAASGCADNPAAVEYAQTIRAAIRDALNTAPPW
jgi:hypothetical protein